ncbi:MAG: hypothetical protein HWQ38_18910 [Nostoc sp. NMS7]|uniref:hypothetical protein n=1 Tax=Nostoc sp. NMS7 TaxID=2815391 RepID=UPI0025DF8363|nr:hypothetical protein [Nostoc sp. NMS7]MBN3948407.1 hypothetical protein [Nostoc sp. NMS7]
MNLEDEFKRIAYERMIADFEENLKLKRVAHKRMIADFEEQLKLNRAIRNIEEQEEITIRYKCYIAIAWIVILGSTLPLFWVN